MAPNMTWNELCAILFTLFFKKMIASTDSRQNWGPASATHVTPFTIQRQATVSIGLRGTENLVEFSRVHSRLCGSGCRPARRLLCRRCRGTRPPSAGAPRRAACPWLRAGIPASNRSKVSWRLPLRQFTRFNRLTFPKWIRSLTAKGDFTNVNPHSPHIQRLLQAHKKDEQQRHNKQNSGPPPQPPSGRRARLDP